MQVPLELTFRNMSKSPELKDYVKEKVAKLELVCDHITSCRIVVEKAQVNPRNGCPYRVRIDLKVPPGHEIIAKEEPGDNDPHTLLPQVINQAFNAADKQLQELVDRQNKRTKKHPEQETIAVISKIYHDLGFGFLETVEGREVYFHSNSISNEDFTKLTPGVGVHYIEVSGETGPQASTVHVTEKIH